MKKVLFFALAFAMVAAPAMAGAVTTQTVGVGTSLTPDTTGGAAPAVQAKWEANVDKWSDDVMLPSANSEGAQFYPTGVKDQNRRIAICSIVSDPDGLTDVKHVYADVYYPVGISVGPDHYKLDSQTGSETAGCGVLMQEDELTPLSKTDGIALFCGDIQSKNNNLPTFNTGYDYSAICKLDGTLQKETAKVYCVEKDLSYEDPAGEYRVKAVVVDAAGKSGTLTNHFDYLAMTAFETDFATISYGNVRLETEKIINGDLAWGTPMATVRNVGNTRAAITISQDDMHFGKTGLNWNVYYKARVGSEFGDWTQYDPNVTVTLNDELNLSEKDEIDFAIFVRKFPDDVTNYSGTMTLGAVQKDHCLCSGETDLSCSTPKPRSEE